jgi:hypothetical protein
VLPAAAGALNANQTLPPTPENKGALMTTKPIEEPKRKTLRLKREKARILGVKSDVRAGVSGSSAPKGGGHVSPI